MRNKILNTFNLSENNVLCIYPYGSYVYGTANESSDHDFIVVCKNGSVEDDFAVTREDLSCHLYTEDNFQEQLNKHKISSLECFFLPEKLLVLETKKFQFKLNIDTLRSSISEKASHSWVKSKKKFEVEKDKNVYIAKKSLFHSFRIIDFGTQIAAHGKIDNYSACNNLWEDLYTDPSESWTDYKNKYQEIFNSKMTQFRLAAPKAVKGK